MKKFYVYLLASDRNGTLYTGVTSDWIKRVYEHKHDLVDGFTKEHHVHQRSGMKFMIRQNQRLQGRSRSSIGIETGSSS